MDGIRHVEAEVRRHHVSTGQPIVYVGVTSDASPPPSNEVRQALVASAKSLMPIVDRMYIVLEGTGFRGSVIRSVMAGMMLVSKMRGLVHTVASVDEALALMGGLDHVDIAAARAAMVRDRVY